MYDAAVSADKAFNRKNILRSHVVLFLPNKWSSFIHQRHLKNGKTLKIWVASVYEWRLSITIVIYSLASYTVKIKSFEIFNN